jgi:2-polyprenyl-3-methyl-5-hydroxy-6-metoxy-1,4-benzoquinol methylase
MHDPNSLAIRAAVSQRIAETGTESSVIDLGCGEGLLLTHLAGLGFKQLAGAGWQISVPPGGLAVPNVDLAAPGWSEKCDRRVFDWVVSTEVIEHLVNPYQFLVEARRLMAPGGRLLLTFPNVHNWRSIVGYAVAGRFSGFFGPNWNDNHPLHDQHIFIPNMHLIQYFLKLNHLNIDAIRYLYGRGRLFGTTTMIEASAIT